MSRDYSRSWSKTYALRDIATPLFCAVIETGGPNPRVMDDNRDTFFCLVEATENLRDFFSEQILAGPSRADNSLQWHITAVSAAFVASHFRASGNVITPADIKVVVPTLLECLYELKPQGSATDSSSPAYLGEPHLSAIEGLIPTVAAITRFDFGLGHRSLLDKASRAIILKVEHILNDENHANLEGGQRERAKATYVECISKLYAESHYAEMDRLLDMPANERFEYASQHDNKPPMDNVWSAFEERTTLFRSLIELVDEVFVRKDATRHDTKASL